MSDAGSQKNIKLNSTNSEYKPPNTMEAAYQENQASTSATATGDPYGYQIPFSTEAYPRANTSSVNSPTNKSNEVNTYSENLAYQGSSVEYERNSMAYQENILGDQANPTEIQNNITYNKAPSKLFQYYCEICKIICWGAKCYKEHLEGQKHKQKEVTSKNEVSENLTNQNKIAMQCEICNVIFKHNNGYIRHVQGRTHAKALLLHNTLGQDNLAEKLTVLNLNNSNDNNDNDESEADIQLLGRKYIEEIKFETGKVVMYKCTLCNCHFPNQLIRHMKGRRHRLQYKKKVDLNLVVKSKTPLTKFKNKKCEETSGSSQEVQNLQNPEVPHYPYQNEQQFQIQEVLNPMSFTDSNNRHMLTKFIEIYPSENEILTVLCVVLDTEKALKFVSEELLESKPKDDNSQTALDQNDEIPHSCSHILGVWRVKHLGKGLLLHKERTVELVVMCSETPTLTFLRKIAELLPAAFKKVTTQQAYSVVININEAGLIVSQNDITVMVQLTNSMLQEECTNEELNQDNLSNEKCFQALTSFEQTMWFYSSVVDISYCYEVILVLRDLCQKVPALMPLNCWILELLIERIEPLPSTEIKLSPAYVFRQVMELVADGILLSGGPGLINPCEGETHNATEFLTDQQRKDITAFAQNSLRLIDLEKIHEVLMMDFIPKFAEIRQKRCSDEESEN